MRAGKLHGVTLGQSVSIISRDSPGRALATATVVATHNARSLLRLHAPLYGPRSARLCAVDHWRKDLAIHSLPMQRYLGVHFSYQQCHGVTGCRFPTLLDKHALLGALPRVLEVHTPTLSDVQVVITPGTPQEQPNVLVDLLDKAGVCRCCPWPETPNWARSPSAALSDPEPPGAVRHVPHPIEEVRVAQPPARRTPEPELPGSNPGWT